MRIPKLFKPWRWSSAKLLATASVLTLFGLALMVWSMLDPTPLPVMLAMTIGQGLGTFAFLLYGIAVLSDVLKARRIRRESGRIQLPEEFRP